MQIQIANTIRERRKQLGWNQEKLAEQLDITAQAVSKWETDSAYPDITLLPRLAKVLSLSLDQLFYGIENQAPLTSVAGSFSGLELPDDGTIRVIQFLGSAPITTPELCTGDKRAPIPLAIPPHEPNIQIHVWGSANINGTIYGSIHAGAGIQCETVNGPASCGTGLTCTTVNGPVTAGTSVQCEKNINGKVTAGGDVYCQSMCDNTTAFTGNFASATHNFGQSIAEIVANALNSAAIRSRKKTQAKDMHVDVECGNVNGDIQVDADVCCGNVDGSVQACGDVECGNVGGNIEADGDVFCGDVVGSIRACGDVECGNVGGDIEADGDVSCGDVGGSIRACGDVECGNVGGDIEADGDVRYIFCKGTVTAGGVATKIDP